MNANLLRHIRLPHLIGLLGTTPPKQNYLYGFSKIQEPAKNKLLVNIPPLAHQGILKIAAATYFNCTELRPKLYCITSGIEMHPTIPNHHLIRDAFMPQHS